MTSSQEIYNSEEYLMNIQMRETLPQYYGRVPHIIDHLTYIDIIENKKTGEKRYFRKRLKSSHKNVYRVLCLMAGESHLCMRTEDYIARYCGCSKKTLEDAKEILSMSFEQLGGGPLISIEEKRTLTTKEVEGEIIKINKKPLHLITIETVWKYNNPFMAPIFALAASDPKRLPPEKMCDEISENEATIAIEKMNQKSAVELTKESVHKSGAECRNAPSPRAQCRNALSSRERGGGIVQKCTEQKNPSKTTLVKVKQPTTLRAVQLSLLSENLLEKVFKCESSALNWLTLFGIKSKIRDDIVKTYPLHEIALSVQHLVKELYKDTKIESLTGYLINTVKFRYWIPKES